MVKSILLALGAFVLVANNVVSADDSSSSPLPNCSCQDDDQFTLACCNLVGQASDNECKLFSPASVPGFQSCCMAKTRKQGDDAYDCKDEYGSS
ncbi:hypothetical protein O0I10_011208 [Lichtheimia ornata]|uniref:Uncharacterized protein n=1 Tax=Lichtheimia ornata TaxID=688661 RepID=A0AAD7UUU6_9FUNG|nr:uncharacterized protein O0I10_011208 [Lichtheimia ornata]KAJ8653159.1 hypothetical protein O0I10_011208 [Lichtheimia ornata]